MKETILKIWSKLTTKEMKTYLFFGVLTTIVSYAVYAFCIYEELSVFWSNTCSTAAGIIFAYVTNKLWVFKAREFSLSVMIPELLKFVSGRLGTYFVETWLLEVLINRLGGNEFIMKGFTLSFVVVTNYIISKKAVFK